MVRLLTAVQFDDGASHFVQQAGAWAERLGGVVDLVTMVDPVLPMNPFGREGGAEGAAMHHLDLQRQQLQRLQDLLDQLPAGRAGEAILRTGDPATELLSMSQSAHILVLGTHHRTGLSRLFLGSVAERVVRSSNTPVLILPRSADAPQGPLQVVVPVDPASSCAAALDWAAKHLPSAAVTAVYALPWVEVFGPVPVPTAEIYDNAREHLVQALEQHGHAQVQPLVAVGVKTHAGDVIAEQARESGAGLIVVPTHGRTGLTRLVLGSVAERIVRASTVPVLVVRHNQGEDDE